MSLDALLAASRSGEPAARRALIEAMYVSLRRFFRRHCSPFDAEDLVQTTFLLVLPKIDDFEPRHSRSFEALVFTTAGRVLFTKQRSWSRERARGAGSITGLPATRDTSVTGRVARRERSSRFSLSSTNSRRSTSARSTTGSPRSDGASRPRSNESLERPCARA